MNNNIHGFNVKINLQTNSHIHTNRATTNSNTNGATQPLPSINSWFNARVETENCVITTPNASVQQVITNTHSIKALNNALNRYNDSAINANGRESSSFSFSGNVSGTAEISSVCLQKLGFTAEEIPHALNLVKRGFGEATPLYDSPQIASDEYLNGMSEGEMDTFLNFWGYQNITLGEKRLIVRTQLIAITILFGGMIKVLHSRGFDKEIIKASILNNNYTFVNQCLDVEILNFTKGALAYLINLRNLRSEGLPENELARIIVANFASRQNQPATT